MNENFIADTGEVHINKVKREQNRKGLEGRRQKGKHAEMREKKYNIYYSSV